MKGNIFMALIRKRQSKLNDVKAQDAEVVKLPREDIDILIKGLPILKGLLSGEYELQVVESSDEEKLPEDIDSVTAPEETADVPAPEEVEESTETPEEEKTLPVDEPAEEPVEKSEEDDEDDAEKQEDADINTMTVEAILKDPKKKEALRILLGDKKEDDVRVFDPKELVKKAHDSRIRNVSETVKKVTFDSAITLEKTDDIEDDEPEKQAFDFNKLFK